jgi:hypothetical protein
MGPTRAAGRETSESSGGGAAKNWKYYSKNHSSPDPRGELRYSMREGQPSC